VTERGALEEEAERLWAEVESGWEESARHDAFLEHCASHRLLASAARRYRARLDQQPGDAVATRMQQRIIFLASQPLAALAGRPRAASPLSRSRWFAVVVLLSAVAGVVGGMLFVR
jgi:hypothetical protein